MDIRYADSDLERLESDPKAGAGLSGTLARAFRKRMWVIRAAVDERDFRNLRSLRFEKLKGARKHQYSMRLNDQYRLIVELETVGESRKQVVIIGIEDYH
jgi:proteic killer suppression protein